MFDRRDFGIHSELGVQRAAGCPGVRGSADPAEQERVVASAGLCWQS